MPFFDLKYMILFYLSWCVKSIEINGPLNAFQFKFVKNPEYSICNSNDIDILIYVHSSPINLKRRILIRDTWAKRSLFPTTRLVFMLGSTNNKTLSDLVDFESRVYNDIVQQDFHDSYRNLTIKCVMALRWVSSYCQHAKYVIKTDDDVMRIKEEKSEHKKEITCRGWRGVVPNRRPKSKWYVSEDEYAETKYPPYCAGFFLLMTNDAITLIYNQTFYEKFFWVDDVWMTGILAKKAGVKILIRRDLVFQYVNVDQRFSTYANATKTLAAHLDRKINLMSKAWDYLSGHYLTNHDISSDQKEPIFNHIFRKNLKKSVNFDLDISLNFV